MRVVDEDSKEEEGREGGVRDIEEPANGMRRT